MDGGKLGIDLMSKSQVLRMCETPDVKVGAFGLQRFDPKAAAEIEKFNGYADAGKDAEFLRDPECLRKDQMPPLYGFKTMFAFYNTFGGLKVDEYARVIGSDCKPTPGLYAGGSDAGGLFDPYYDTSIALGSTQLWDRVSGYWAASRAVGEYMA